MIPSPPHLYQPQISTSNRHLKVSFGNLLRVLRLSKSSFGKTMTSLNSSSSKTPMIKWWVISSMEIKGSSLEEVRPLTWMIEMRKGDTMSSWLNSLTYQEGAMHWEEVRIKGERINVRANQISIMRQRWQALFRLKAIWWCMMETI